MGGGGELDIALDDAVSDRFAIEALDIDTLGYALDIAFRHLVSQVNDHQDHVVILHLGISHEGRIGALEESGRRAIGFLASRQSRLRMTKCNERADRVLQLLIGIVPIDDIAVEIVLHFLIAYLLTVIEQRHKGHSHEESPAVFEATINRGIIGSGRQSAG